MTAILIVEDDTTLRETLSSTLRAHGYDVYALPDARGLLEKVLEIKPDLLLLDVMLPGFDGLTACRALRTAGNKVPVLMLSAQSNDMDKIVGSNGCR